MLDSQQQISSIDGGALKDISTYLKPVRFGATALVGFFPADPMLALQTVQHKGFVLTAQPLAHGVQRFFSKKRIRSTLRDDEGKRIHREINGTFLLLKLLTPDAYILPRADPRIATGAPASGPAGTPDSSGSRTNRV